MKKSIVGLLIALLFLVGCTTAAPSAATAAPQPPTTHPQPPLDEADLIAQQSILITRDVATYSIKSYGKGAADRITDISIVNDETQAVVNEIRLLDYMSGEGVHKDHPFIECIDMNFDGYNDLSLFAEYNGNWNITYIQLLWDAQAGHFVYDSALSALGLPTFDAQTQRIHSMERGSAADHIYYTHGYVGGDLTLLEEITEVAVELPQGASEEQLLALLPEGIAQMEGIVVVRYTTRAVGETGGALHVVADVYRVMEMDAWSVLADYDVSSEVGARITALLAQ